MNIPTFSKWELHDFCSELDVDLACGTVHIGLTEVADIVQEEGGPEAKIGRKAWVRVQAAATNQGWSLKECAPYRKLLVPSCTGR